MNLLSDSGATLGDDLPLARFAAGLFGDGRVVSAGGGHRELPTRSDLATTIPIVQSAAANAAADAPYARPTIDLDSAMWAVQAMAWGCGLLVDRSEIETTLPDWLNQTRPDGSSPSHHAGVEVAFRYAVDLIGRVAKLGTDDPLHAELEKLFSPWPLATVGTSLVNPDAAVRVVMSDRSLSATMIDRILLRGDKVRAADPVYADAIARVVGGHPELARNVL